MENPDSKPPVLMGGMTEAELARALEHDRAQRLTAATDGAAFPAPAKSATRAERRAHFDEVLKAHGDPVAAAELSLPCSFCGQPQPRGLVDGRCRQCYELDLCGGCAAVLLGDISHCPAHGTIAAGETAAAVAEAKRVAGPPPQSDKQRIADAVTLAEHLHNQYVKLTGGSTRGWDKLAHGQRSTQTALAADAIEWCRTRLAGQMHTEAQPPRVPVTLGEAARMLAVNACIAAHNIAIKIGSQADGDAANLDAMLRSADSVVALTQAAHQACEIVAASAAMQELKP